MAQHHITLESRSNITTLNFAHDAATRGLEVEPVTLTVNRLTMGKLESGDRLILETPDGVWLGTLDDTDPARGEIYVSLT